MNHYKVGGSIRRLKRVENYLWHGFVEDAIAELNQLTKKTAIVSVKKSLGTSFPCHVINFWQF